MSESQVPDIWGGVECTINRLNDCHLDQFTFGNVYNNSSFIDAVIDLEIKTIRFPIVWEKHQPYRSTNIDWSWTQSCLKRFQSNNVNVIATLLHHGSGPLFTNLLDENFPELLAEYAGKVAAQFPWLSHYTPVNEPLTTARFSGLYGHWYPHKKDSLSFLKMLLIELKGVVLSMQAIRKINPLAKLVQTEDLGKTYSSLKLSYQAEFENQRRWLTYDVLCGKFNEEHPLWKYVTRAGISSEQLEFFIDNPCPPDIIGVNHYLTSERYLDENIHLYPKQVIGGNKRHAYADVEAARMPINEPTGFAVLAAEVWRRYGIAIAVTEIHLDCSREEQLRWFNHIYTSCIDLKKEGVNVIAVTMWALLGSFGWNKLLTSPGGKYEAGAFDISIGYPRPTALALFVKSLIAKSAFHRDLLVQSGWWSRPSRFYISTAEKYTKVTNTEDTCRPLIIIGKTGTLGQAFSRICTQRNIHHYLLDRGEADICNLPMLQNMINKYRPWAVVNAAGYVRVDDAEENTGACHEQNYVGVQNLSDVCNSCGIKLMSFSTDLVFDGSKALPYVETDAPNPLNVYGKSKRLAEEHLASNNPQSLMIRTAAFFGPWDTYNFLESAITTLESGQLFYAPDDITISPTYVPHLVNAALDLLIDNATGIWHLANRGCLTWFDLAKKAASRLGINLNSLIPAAGLSSRASRPPFSALQSIKYGLMPSLDEALEDYFASRIRLNETALISSLK